MIAGRPGRRPNESKRTRRGDSDPPAWLSESAAAVWRELHPLLTEAGLLAAADCTLLASYCSVAADVVQLSKQLTETGGPVLSSRDGVPYVNPAYSLLRSARRELVSLGRALGIGPRARKALGVEVESDGRGGNGLLRFLAAGQSPTGGNAE